MKKVIVAFLIFSFFSCKNESKTQKEFTTSANETITIFRSEISPKASVFIFLSPECPLCQNYSKVLNELYKKYSVENIQFYGVASGSTYSVDEVESYRTSYEISFPIIMDIEYQFAHLFGASKTPQVFVLDEKKEIIYNGAIDNWAFALGKKRQVVTEHYLSDVLEAIVSNQQIKVAQTETIGCIIE